MSSNEDASEQEIGLVGPVRQSSWTNHMLDWIALADKKTLPDPSVRLYWVLKSFIIEDKGQEERVVQIVQEDLAEMMHRSVDSIQRALKPLYEAGLVEDRERRKISARVPGQARPQVTTLLIMQINEAEPPAGYTGWVKPFEARKDIRARRAAAKEVAGQTDTADLRPQSEQDDADNSGDEGAPPASPATDGVDDVSAGGTDTADLPETGADLPETGADLPETGADVRRIGSNPSGDNPSGSNPSGTGGRNAAPQTPASRAKADRSESVVATELEYVGKYLDEIGQNDTAQAEDAQPRADWPMWSVLALREELTRRQERATIFSSPANERAIVDIIRALKAKDSNWENDLTPAELAGATWGQEAALAGADGQTKRVRSRR